MERKSKFTCAFATLIVLAIALFALRALDPVHWFLYQFYYNPIVSVSLTVCIVSLIGAIILSDSHGNDDLVRTALIIAVVSGILCIYWGIVFKPNMMIGLYKQTDYKQVEQLVPVNEPRPVSYAEAVANFNNQNPEARFGPGDLDYVRGEWISDFGPSTFWNKIVAPTQGFFVYKPEERDKVQIVRQEMPFAESGYLWNSVKFFVYRQDPFVEFHEVLYIEDPNGGYMAMTSLIKRSGWRRVPYVYKVLLIHANRDTEWLSPALAENDERLEGIQLTPEWLAKRQVEAYGWRNGVAVGLFSKRGRIEVQNSVINKENTAPYHLETFEGPMWYTPFGPLNKSSMKGIMMQDSHKVGSPIMMWSLPGDQAYQGVDALATEIKAAPNHPGDINWLRLSELEGGTNRSGDTDIIEMIPVPRRENDEVVLYFMGYVAIDPPVSTRFYVIINAETREVLEDIFEIKDVTAWLNGEKELKIQTEELSDFHQESSEEAFYSLPDMSVESLLDLLRQITDELENRSINK